MNLLKTIILGGLFTSLAACSSIPAKIEDMPPPPPKDEILYMLNGWVTLDDTAVVKIRSVKPERVFFEGFDYVACITITTDENVYKTDKRGKIVSAIGADGVRRSKLVREKLTRVYAMMMRKYENGWSSPLFRDYWSWIGERKVEDLCERSYPD